MILSDILIFIILSVSVSQMWNFSKIFLPVRNLVARIPYIKTPLLCMECSSFWMGVFTSLFYNPFLMYFNWYIALATAGLVTHLVASYLFKLYIKLS